MFWGSRLPLARGGFHEFRGCRSISASQVSFGISYLFVSNDRCPSTTLFRYIYIIYIWNHITLQHVHDECASGWLIAYLSLVSTISWCSNIPRGQRRISEQSSPPSSWQQSQQQQGGIQRLHIRGVSRSTRTKRKYSSQQIRPGLRW